MTTSMSPVVTSEKLESENMSANQSADNCLQIKNMLVKYSTFDVEEDKYMAVSLNFRGDVQSKDAKATV